MNENNNQYIDDEEKEFINAINNNNNNDNDNNKVDVDIKINYTSNSGYMLTVKKDVEYLSDYTITCKDEDSKLIYEMYIDEKDLKNFVDKIQHYFLK
jgi:hypothetical protein